VNLELQGKVVLVTAASRGIGLAIARSMAREGAHVAICGRDPDALSAARERLGAEGPSAVAFRADLPQPEDIERLIEEVTDDWESAWEAILRPVILLVGAVAPGMCSGRDGRIVMMTSTWVKQPKLGGVLSSVMRSAVAALAKQLSNELAGFGVLVNHVMPGATDTARMEEIVQRAAASRGVPPAAIRDELNSAVPLGRAAHVDEIAALVTFLAGGHASYVTVASIQVDGGAVQGML
jgi:3-oxoacyl-[acyl-carrier protein] reductase